MNMLRKFIQTSFALSTTCLMLSACNESSSSSHGNGYDIGDQPIETDFDEKALISNLSEIVTTAFTEFAEQTEDLSQSVSSYCQALSNATLANERDLAQASWRENMVLWQSVEMMQLEPLLANEGKLRDDIYSWPEVYPCGVDFDTMYHEADDFNGAPYDITARKANRKGLFALEYILFNESTGHSCGTETPPNWNDFTSAEITLARCEFAETVASDIARNADELIEQWSGENGFIHELISAGTDQSSIESTHAAVNLLSDAMFYLDSLTKDIKLARPLGLEGNSCGAEACSQDVESPYANHSMENIANNLAGFEQFFTGGEGIGFVDYLEYVGDADTASTMSAAIDKAKAQIALYEASLAETLVSDEAQVEQTHSNVKAITDDLKSDFITSLALELPQTSAGDND